MSLANDGAVWQQMDIEWLEKMFYCHCTLEQMAKNLGRTGSAVCSQLVKMDLIFYRRLDNAYHVKTPWAKVSDASKINPKPR